MVVMVTTGYPNWWSSWSQQDIPTSELSWLRHDILTGGCHGKTGYPNKRLSWLRQDLLTDACHAKTGYPNCWLFCLSYDIHF
jgi:hypothetical protein